MNIRELIDMAEFSIVKEAVLDSLGKEEYKRILKRIVIDEPYIIVEVKDNLEEVTKIITNMKIKISHKVKVQCS